MLKRAAVIQDISGLGRCSLAAALPVLSVMGIQCCPVPTAVFTNQTGFSRYASLDCESLLLQFPDLWKEHGVQLDGIYTGYMASPGQLRAAQAMIDAFRTPDCLLLVDPVMGDDGRRYPSFDSTFCEEMRTFAAQADVITPNVTEACLLAGADYRDFAQEDAAGQEALLRQISTVLPAQTVVITGWRKKDAVCIFARQDHQILIIESPAVQGSFSGTGDLLASALCGGLLRGDSLEASLRRAMRFLQAALRDAVRFGLPGPEGIPFELHLKELLL